MSKLTDLAKVMQSTPQFDGSMPKTWGDLKAKEKDPYFTKAANVIMQVHNAGYELVKTRGHGGEP